MKRTLITLSFLLIIQTFLFAQEKDLVKIADSIKNEGTMLFKSEWASWYGTDIFLDKCKDKKSLIAGYISYDTGKGLKNIFFSKDADPVVLATTSFGYDFNPQNFTLDTLNRKLTTYENELYTIRKAALERLGTDTTFKRYINTGTNPVPIISKGIKRVYILTSPQATGIVMFGNDYLIDFNKDNTISSVKKQHKGLITVNAKTVSADNPTPPEAAIHSHLPGYSDFMTATDVCTAMLYQKLTTWKQVIVVSKNYVSLWDYSKNDLLILTMEAWKRIGASMDKPKSLKN
ncbi:hypothetical protein [Mucilaginibacter sp.]|uniref:hypothetical protein n=1 Tax=Mucilaginibacter sp. TaxID=1882438 RepID=UPI003D11AFA6